MRTANAALKGGSVLATLLLAVGLSSTTTPPVLAQAGTQGQWRTLTNQVPINPVHVALLRTGQVLIVAGSGNVATETNFQAAVWDPAAETFQTRTLGWDMFCNGMVTLHDGRVLINGGNLKYDPFWGEPRNAVFDPMTGLFTDVENMLHGRWYPTVTTLGDGRVMTFSGLRETGGTNTAVEMYTVGSGWSQEFPAGWTPPLYPRMHLSTDGRVFYAGSTRSSRFFSPSTGTWTPTVATTNHSVSRTYGTSVLLPLTPANGYRPRVMILGGGNPGTATTEIIDLSAATPQWQFGPSMSQPRIQMNATLLPNGKVLATGGSRDDESAVTASLNGDLYDPGTNTFSSAGANVFPRLYHSNALLLADATVLLIGGNPQRGNYEPRLEIYSPAYLFNGDGSAAVRPTITGLTPETAGYGSTFQVQTPNAADIASVVLVRPGTPTHAFDMDQRLVGLSFTAGSGLLNVTAPPNGNIAPPGYYMLFVLNSAGVPSVARFVKVSASVPSFDFALANGGNKSVVRGSPVDNSIAATLVSGATQNVVFSTSGLPAGATASYTPSSCSPGCATTMTIGTTAATPLATSTITVTGTAGSLVRSTTFSLTVTSPGDTTAPTVALGASPANGSTIIGTVTLSATASDNVGVVGVQFLLDGANLGAEDTTSPYSISWNTTTTSSGPHALSARARDAAGNTALATVVNVTVDNQAPTGTIVINGGAAATNSRTATLTLAASDNAGVVAQMRFSNSSSGFSTAEAYATTKTWTLTSGAGTKTVYVQFRDAVGNWSSVAMTDTIVLDTTAPTISSVAHTGVTNGSATITWTTNEPANSQVAYGLTTAYGTLTALDGTLVTAHSTPMTGLTPQTTYNYRVRSTDAAGNLRLGANRTLTTLAGPPDATPPSVPTNLVAQAVSATQINLSWTASTDNVAVTGYKVFRNGTQIATVTALSYSSVGLTPNTSYTYTVAATDAQNNTSAPSSAASATTLPDTTLPTVSMTSPANNASVFGTISVTANANDNIGIAGVTFKVDGANIGTEDTSSPYAVNLNTATLSDGSHTLTAVARDTANNSATSAPVVILVDNTTPPSTMIRYVNTASTAGGDGTTNGTSGANRAFRSLLDAINSLPDVLTMPVVIYCDGAGGPDTAAIDQAPFDMVTSAANYLLVTTNASNRAKVPHDPARYTLAATNTNALYNNIPSHIRFDGIQVQLTVTNGSSYLAIKTSNANQVATDIDARISNSVVKCVVTSGGAVGFNTLSPGAGAGGSSAVWNSVAYGCTTGFNSDFVGALYVNNTAFNSDFGYVDDGGMKVINCLAAKGSKAGSIGFVGTFAAGSDYNAEDDGNGLPGAHSRSGRTFTFVNAAVSDVHLAPTDTGARDFGLSNPLPGKFTDDIDGILRSGVWDIGADEVESPQNVHNGRRPLTITGSRGGRTHSVNVTLVIQ